jgi:RNA polymerase sigma-70 factor (sigma-E family)
VNHEARRQFTDFVAARSTALIRLAYVLTGDQHAAEDLLQSALTKTAARWRHINGNPEAYVRKAMYNEQIGRWRSPRWRRELASDTVPEVPVDDPSREIVLRLALEQALYALSPRRRIVLVLRYFDDLPEAEVARIMGCSVGTVRSQTHRALARLRELAPDLVEVLEPELIRRST